MFVLVELTDKIKTAPKVPLACIPHCTTPHYTPPLPLPYRP